MEFGSKYVYVGDDEDDFNDDFVSNPNNNNNNADVAMADAPANPLFAANPSPQPAKPKTPTVFNFGKPRKAANPNVVSISLSKLTDKDVTLMTGDPMFCSQCKAAYDLLHHENNKEKQGEKEKAASNWKCEFCGTTNELNPLDEEEIPKAKTLDYMLEPAKANSSSLDESLVIFCIDISGSMGVSFPVKGGLKAIKGNNLSKLAALNTEGADQFYGQPRDVTYISRLQCVQAAIDKQIEELHNTKPNSKVALIVFNREVTVIGDGTQAPITIAGDKLSDYEQLITLAAAMQIQNPISKSITALRERLFSLEETGATALGPALVIATTLAGKAKGSKVVIATDGLSNVGIGAMDADALIGDDAAAKVDQFYTQVAIYAKEKASTVSVISISNDNCNLFTLGKVVDQTGGDVQLVDPFKLTENFSNILARKIIATECKITVFLHPGLTFTNEEDVDKNGNKVNRSLGNVFDDSEESFEFETKSKDEIRKLGITKDDVALPFQVQVQYVRPDGMKCVRIISENRLATFQRKVAEDHLNLNVIAQNAEVQSAKYAHKGNYEMAMANNVLNDHMMNRWAAQPSRAQESHDHREKQTSNWVSFQKAYTQFNDLLSTESPQQQQQPQQSPQAQQQPSPSLFSFGSTASSNANPMYQQQQPQQSPQPQQQPSDQTSAAIYQMKNRRNANNDRYRK